VTNPEGLRETIVWAALPLIGEYDTLTTAQIAEAAGIDEATLLAVFDDKDAVIQACIATVKAHITAAFDPTQVLQKLNSISVDQPLATRLAEVIDSLDAYYGRIRTKLDALRDPNTRPTPGAAFSRDDFRAVGRLPEICQAVARLLEPDQQHLRLPAEALAEAFLGMSLGAARTPHPDRSPLPTERLVDLFLHGALSTTERVDQEPGGPNQGLPTRTK
jgi:AcrR family transcriptional regulator